MIISEFIDRLNRVLKEKGDIEVVINVEDDYSRSDSHYEPASFAVTKNYTEDDGLWKVEVF